MSLRSPAENEMGKSHYTATSKIVTPERFNRGASPKCSGFPLRARGNDGPPERHDGTPDRIFEGALKA